MEAPGAWTQTVALNYLRRKLRRRPPRRWHERDAPEPELPDRDLWGAVRSLPPRQQMAMVLRYVHDLSYEQIAETMAVSPGAVASTLAAAHRNLGPDGLADGASGGERRWMT
jgi:RNA polymerase sigma factor (sigma-70 family)